MVTVRQSQFGIAITWIIVNTVLMLIGAGVAIIGFLVSFSPEGLCFLYRDDMRQVLAEIYPLYLANRCIDFGDILGWDAKLGTILFGGILFICGLWAVACAVWPRAWALGVYIVVISLYVVVLAAVLIVYFIAMDVSIEHNATDYVRGKLNETLVQRYLGDDGNSDEFTRFVNFVNRKFNCCGIDGNFEYAQYWDRMYTLPTVESSLDVRHEVKDLPMSCCMRQHLEKCYSDIQAPEDKPLGDSWVKLGCFEGELASNAERVAKYLAIALAVFVLFLAFSLTLAFIICTPILAARKRSKADFGLNNVGTAANTTAETSPGGYERQSRPPPLPPPLPRQSAPVFVEDAVSRWHSQFGSRFYDNQIFKSYNRHNSHMTDDRT